jgi:hypothetical protein
MTASYVYYCKKCDLSYTSNEEPIIRLPFYNAQRLRCACGETLYARDSFETKDGYDLA